MISRYDSKDGQRALIAVTTDEDIGCTKGEDNTNLIEGSLDALRVLYDCLADLFCGEDGEDEEEA